MKKLDHNYIQIKNASVHNLKSVDIDIPKNEITVITGPSGSGKSSLAFDTLFVEGQRRFIESLFSSSRHYLDKFSETSVEKITGLSPSISVEQKNKNLGPRSTVGTQTEIYDYLRVLFSKLSRKENETTKKIEGSSKVLSEYLNNNLKKDTVITFFTIVEETEVNDYINQGFEKEITSSGIVDILKENESSHHIVVKKIKVSSPEIMIKKLDMILAKFKKLGFIEGIDFDQKIYITSENTNNKITPQNFSFNSPYGYCPECKGTGIQVKVNLDSLIGDQNISIIDGGLNIFSQKKDSLLKKMTISFLESLKLPKSITMKGLSSAQKEQLFFGSNKKINFTFKFHYSNYNFTDFFPGIIKSLENKYIENKSTDTEGFTEELKCTKCDGSRLNSNSSLYKVNNYSLPELVNCEIDDLIIIINGFNFSKNDNIISLPLMKEIKNRLKFLIDVGLGYLTLNRPSNTLSGGEAQRIKIATQLGSSLSGVTYILDEPSIGLHPKDNKNLINTLKKLKDLRNTIVIVEHDEDVIKNADYIIDMGPGAGQNGGNIIAKGKLPDLTKDKNSLTGKYLRKKKSLLNNAQYLNELNIEINGITSRNIKNESLIIPRNKITAITGVSGSGKSTLIHEVFSNAVKYNISNKNLSPLYKKDNYKEISGLEDIKQIIELDQKPIGRSSKSNPSTYLGFFTLIRELFASTPESKLKGYKAKHFSFNLKDGRCNECDGNGEIKVEMQFLPDVSVTCKSCKGKKFSDKILNIKYKNHDISQVLNLSINEASNIFSNHKKISHTLEILKKIGLGYIKIGQSSKTLSGGEAQRLKIAKELSKNTKGETIYILDEPSTGLHFSDIELLQNCIFELKSQGHTIIVIEHNTDIVKKADYIVDMGPGGGRHGGQILYQGPISQIKKSKNSVTKKFL